MHHKLRDDQAWVWKQDQVQINGVIEGSFWSPLHLEQQGGALTLIYKIS